MEPVPVQSDYVAWLSGGVGRRVQRWWRRPTTPGRVAMDLMLALLLACWWGAPILVELGLFAAALSCVRALGIRLLVTRGLLAYEMRWRPGPGPVAPPGSGGPARG